MGRPGVDFPIMTYIPRTDFSCKKVKKPGYYADPETDCQVNIIKSISKSLIIICILLVILFLYNLYPINILFVNYI